jgi:hypothetical protein
MFVATTSDSCHRRRDDARDLGHFGDRRADPLDSEHGFGRGVLDPGDLFANLFGGLGCLRRQHLDLGRHNGETPASLAGARRLDCGVQRQQIGLLGDVRDDFHSVADTPRGNRQFIDSDVRRAGAGQ